MKHLIWVTWETEDDGRTVPVASRVVCDTHDQAATKYAWMANHLPDWLMEHGHVGVLNPRVELQPARDCDRCDEARKQEEREIARQRAGSAA